MFDALVLLLALPLLRFRFQALVALYSVGSQSVAYLPTFVGLNRE